MFSIIKAMFSIINIFEIVSDYIKDMKEDLKLLSLLINLVGIPLVIAGILSCLIKDIKNFSQTMITITSIFVPLLLNVLIIVHYSIEKTIKNSKNGFVNLKLEFLKHINSTTAMVIFISVFILFISIVISNINSNTIPKITMPSSLLWYLYVLMKFILMFFVGFMFVNIIIALLRVYRLISFEIKEYEDGGYDH